MSTPRNVKLLLHPGKAGASPCFALGSRILLAGPNCLPGANQTAFGGRNTHAGAFDETWLQGELSDGKSAKLQNLFALIQNTLQILQFL
jgi:hypothetical protein